MLLALARGQEVGATLFIFFDPSLGKTAVANLREDLAHLFPRLLGDDARPSGIITLFGGIADGVAHVAEAAAVNQVHDEFELMHAFEIGDLWLVARFRKRFEARLDQFTHTTAEHGLLAEKIGFGLFRKSGLKNAGARAAESFGISQSKCFRGAAGILFHCQEHARSAAFGEDFANAMAGG